MGSEEMVVALAAMSMGTGLVVFIVHSIRQAVGGVLGRGRAAELRALTEEVRALRAEVQQLRQQNTDIILGLDSSLYTAPAGRAALEQPVGGYQVPTASPERIAGR